MFPCHDSINHISTYILIKSAAMCNPIALYLKDRKRKNTAVITFEKGRKHIWNAHVG